ncbi:MAG: flagellar biosynthetic protein FliO [Clostridiales bacterium]|nr:flagellar biosynthetic protein FliO [Clostridiales bacterium]
MILSSALSTLENVLQLLGLLILFIIILIATYFTTRFIGQFQTNKFKNSNFKVIESFKLSQGKFLMLINISSKYYVIALGKNEISVITELDEDDVIQVEEKEIGQIDFSKYLEKFSKKKNK